MTLIIKCVIFHLDMQVFFTATYQGQKQFGSFYKKIYEEIKNLGYSHLDHEVVNITYEDYLKKMEVGRESQVSNYHETINFIKKADICVLETSAHSLGLGFIVQKSLEMSKPTVVLYYEDNIPYFLAGIEDEKLLVKSYNEKNIKKVLSEAFELARERRDKRFNFFLSPKLLEYLELASKKEGVTKSKLIRDLIVDHMRNESKMDGIE